MPTGARRALRARIGLVLQDIAVEPYLTVRETNRALHAAAERHPQAVQATPLPAGTHFLGLLAHCIMVSAVDVALIVGIGAAFGTPLSIHWPTIAVALVLGAASFCALGVAVASLIRNSEAAPGGRAAGAVPAGVHLRQLVISRQPPVHRRWLVSQRTP
jgi:hypothetical protein